MGESDTNYAHRVAQKQAGATGDIKSAQDGIMAEITRWNQGEYSAVPIAFGQAMSKVEELETKVNNGTYLEMTAEQLQTAVLSIIEGLPPVQKRPCPK